MLFILSVVTKTKSVAPSMTLRSLCTGYSMFKRKSMMPNTSVGSVCAFHHTAVPEMVRNHVFLVSMESALYRLHTYLT